MAKNRTNSLFFFISDFSTFWFSESRICSIWGQSDRAKIYWKLVWNSPRFVLVLANLTLFGPKSDTLGQTSSIEAASSRKKNCPFLNTYQLHIVRKSTASQRYIRHWAGACTDSLRHVTVTLTSTVFRFGPKCVSLTHNGTNPGLYHTSIQVGETV